MLKTVAVQFLAYALTCFLCLSALRGEVSRDAYLFLAAVFCMALVLGCVFFLRRSEKLRDAWRRILVAQHIAFVALVISTMSVSADLIISGRESGAEPTPLMWILVVVLAVWTLLTFAATFLNALKVLSRQQQGT